LPCENCGSKNADYADIFQVATLIASRNFAIIRGL
jgi:hypothetical protein